MASANQIREAILSFAEPRDNNRFVLEFSEASFDIRNSEDAEAVQLADAIQANLAAVSVGHARLDDLYKNILMLAGTVVQEAEPVGVVDVAPQVVTGTSTLLSAAAAAGALVGGMVGVGRAWEYAS